MVFCDNFNVFFVIFLTFTKVGEEVMRLYIHYKLNHHTILFWGKQQNAKHRRGVRNCKTEGLKNSKSTEILCILVLTCTS